MGANSQISLFRLSFTKVNDKLKKDALENKSKPVEISEAKEFVKYLMAAKGAPYNKFKELKKRNLEGNQGFELQVFYQLIPLKAKWTDFFSSVIHEDEDRFFSDLNQHKSFVGFVYKEKELFAFCGGLGSHIVRDFIDDEFGISLLIRLLKKDDVEIKRIINKALAGAELVADRFFKANHRIGNEDMFGKIYKSIYTHFHKDLIKEELGLPAKEKDRGATAVARTFFQLGRAISYSELIKMISKIESILKKEPLFELNKIKQITGRKIGDKELLQKLNAKLTVDIFTAFKNSTLDKFELFHKNLEEFLNSTTFIIRRGRKTFESIDGITNFNLPGVFNVIAEDLFFTNIASADDPEELDHENEEHKEKIELLLSLLEKYRIEGTNSDDDILTEGSILSYIQGETQLDGATYFYLEESWYRATDGFIDDVNDGCAELVAQLNVDGLLPQKWSHENDDEEAYIERYFGPGHADVFPLHKVLLNKIELCDLLVKKDRTVYFVHIKQGFSASVRDLVSQIYISAKLFIDELKNDKSWEQKELLDGYFNALKSLNDSSSYGTKFKAKYKTFRKQSFINLFKDVDNFYFVFAIYDNAGTEKVLPKDIKKFTSNIAKMSLINLDKEIAAISPRTSSLKFVQIRRE